MYLPNGYMMAYYPQMPPSNMPVYGMENSVQGRTTSGLFEANVSPATLLQNPLLVPNAGPQCCNAAKLPVGLHFCQGSCQFKLFVGFLPLSHLCQKPSLLVYTSVRVPVGLNCLQSSCQFTLLSEAMSVLNERLQSMPLSVTCAVALPKPQMQRLNKHRRACC